MFIFKFFCFKCFFYRICYCYEFTYILISEKHKCENWEREINGVIELASHFPGGDLSWISFRLEVVGSSVEPMSIAVNVKLIEVSELVEGMVLQVMGLNLLILGGLWLVLEPGLVRDSSALIISWLLSSGEDASIEGRPSQN